MANKWERYTNPQNAADKLLILQSRIDSLSQGVRDLHRMEENNSISPNAAHVYRRINLICVDALERAIKEGVSDDW